MLYSQLRNSRAGRRWELSIGECAGCELAVFVAALLDQRGLSFRLLTRCGSREECERQEEEEKTKKTKEKEDKKMKNYSIST